MTNSGKLFANYLEERLIEAGYVQSQYQMFMYYKYAPGGFYFCYIYIFMTVYIGCFWKL